MPHVLVDTNIVLDLLKRREQFYQEAQTLFTLADQDLVKLYVSSLTIANTHYLLSREYDSQTARKILIRFKILVTVFLLLSIKANACKCTQPNLLTIAECPVYFKFSIFANDDEFSFTNRFFFLVIKYVLNF